MAGTGTTNDLSMLSNNFGYLTKGLFLGFDKPLVDTHIPGTSYGMFRYEKDGGGAAADTLAFLCGQAFGGTTGSADGANTPAEDNHQSSFWSMLSEKEAVSPGGGVADYVISRLIFEPIVDYNYDANGGADDGYYNYSYIGWHNTLSGVYSYYMNAGYGAAAFPSHTFIGDSDTGMYRISSNIVGFGAGNVPVAGFWGSRDTSDEALPIDGGGLYPQTTNIFDLGTSSYLWDDVYATNGTIQTSDARLKEHITPTTLGLDFVNDLNPVSYKWKEKKENKLNQTHYGIVAQEVMETLTKYGINSVEDFGGITHSGGEEDYYGARYGEFVPILIKAVQELSAEVKDLKEKL